MGDVNWSGIRRLELNEEHAAALGLVEDALGQAPKEPALHVHRVRLLSRMGRLDEANAIYESATTGSPGEAWALVGLAQCLYQRKAYQEALALCSRASAAVPRDVAILTLAATCALRAGSHAEALQYAERALTVDPASTECVRIAGDASSGLGDAGCALRYAEREIALAPDSADAYARAAGASMDIEDFVAALGFANQALCLAPKNFRATSTASSASLALGDIEGAVRYARTLVSAAPTLAAGRRLAAMMSALSGDWAGCWEHARKVAELDPSDPHSYLAVVKEIFEEHHVPEAAGAHTCAQQLLELLPQSSNAHWLAAAASLDTGRYREAVAYARRAVELAPDDAHVHCTLSRALYTVGEMAESLQHGRRAVELSPSFLCGYQRVANASLALGDLDGALASALRAIDASPDNALSHMLASDVYEARGECAAALEHAERAVALAPDALLPHISLGDVYDNLGRHEEALQQFEYFISHVDAGAPFLLGWLLPSVRAWAAMLCLDLDRTDDAQAHLAAATGLLKPPETDDGTLMGAMAPYNAILVDLVYSLLYSEMAKADAAIEYAEKVRAAAAQMVDERWPARALPAGIASRLTCMPYFVCGLACLILERNGDALRYVKEAVAIAPDLPEAYELAAYACYRLADDRQCAEHARQAMQLAPRDALARSLLGVSLLWLGDHAAARHHLEACLDLDDSDSENWAACALGRLQTGAMREALQTLVSAQERFPDSGYLAVLRGYLEAVLHGGGAGREYLDQALAKDVSDADICCVSIASVDPAHDLVRNIRTHAAAYLNLGGILYREGRYRLALAEFNKALDVQEHPAAYRACALAHRALGEELAAAECDERGAQGIGGSHRGAPVAALASIGTRVQKQTVESLLGSIFRPDLAGVLGGLSSLADVRVCLWRQDDGFLQRQLIWRDGDDLHARGRAKADYLLANLVPSFVAYWEGTGTELPPAALDMLVPVMDRPCAESLAELPDGKSVLLHLDDAVAALPLELGALPGLEPLCLRLATSRLLSNAQEQRRLPTLASLKPPYSMAVVALDFSSDSIPLAAARRELEQILRATRKAQDLGLVQIDTYLDPLSASDMRSLVLQRYQIVHIIAHGRPEGTLQTGSSPISVLQESFVRDLAPAPRLVFANCCWSGPPPMPCIDGGSPRAFREAGVPHYVGTFCRIPDNNEATWVIAAEFYRGLFTGLPTGEAFRRARAEARKLDPRVWSMYLLYGLPEDRLSVQATS